METKILEPQWFLGRNTQAGQSIDNFNHWETRREILDLAACAPDLDLVKAKFLEMSDTSYLRLSTITREAERFSQDYFERLSTFIQTSLENCGAQRCPPDVLVLLLWDASREFGSHIIQENPIDLEWRVRNLCPDQSQMKICFHIAFDESRVLKPFAELYGNSNASLRGDFVWENYFYETEKFLRGYVED